MKAIQIKYLAPTNTKPSRYKASIKDNRGIIASITEPMNYNEKHDTESQPYRLAEKLIKKLEWDTTISGIGTYNEDYYVTLK